MNVYIREKKIETSKPNNNCIANKYSVFIAFLPIFGIYTSGIPGFNAGEIILSIFLFICLLHNLIKKNEPQNRRTTKMFMVLLLYIYASTMISISVQGGMVDTTDIIIRIIRFSFFFICVVYTSKYYFNAQVAAKWVVRISIVATIYIIMQYISYYSSGIILPSFIPHIPIYSASIYGEFTYNVKNFYRPTSFFIEPSHLVQYTVIGLILVLFNEEKQIKYKMFKTVFISVAIILSTSIQGIIVIPIVWISWWLKFSRKKLNAKNIILSIMFGFIMIIVIILLYNTSIIQNTFSRLMDGSSVFESNAFIARFQGYSFFDYLPNYLKVIGLGYGSIPSKDIFMSSIAYMLYGGGYISIVIISILFLRLYKKAISSEVKIIILVSLVLLTATEWLYVYIFVYYFSFICYGNTLKEKRLLG